MHSGHFLAFAKKNVNPIQLFLAILEMPGPIHHNGRTQAPHNSKVFANLVIWRHWRAPERQIGDFLAQKITQKKVCLKMLKIA